jgi:hypothetical protein
MRIVSYDEFMALPVGTIYSHFRPCIVEGLFRKGYMLTHEETGKPYDFTYIDLLGDVDNDTDEYTTRPPGDCGRDGFYGYDDRKLLVYEKSDIAILVGLLKGEPHELDGKR